MATFYLFFPVLHHRVQRVRPKSLKALALTLHLLQSFMFIILSGVRR